MKRSQEMRQELKNLLTEVKTLNSEGKKADAHAKLSEIKNLEQEIEIQEAIEKDEELEVDTKIENKREVEELMDTKNTAKALRATIKAMMGKKLTDAENALVVTGTNGEGYILPQDIRTKIIELTRQMKSMRDVLGYLPTTALTGSFPVEDFETVSELIDFDDDVEMTEATDIKFKNVPFSLKQKGAIIPLGNTLLQMSDNDLIEYVARVFAKKAVITENKMAFTVLNTGKTAKALADWKALKKSINVDIDEGVKFGLVVVTNQDGFDSLDSALDANGRPVLVPDVTQPNVYKFNGYPVVVFSNALLPTTGTTTKKAPVYYGNLSLACQFVDNGTYDFAVSSHAGFTKNVTIARMIEHVDVVKTDGSDKVYLVGEFTIA